MTSPFSAFKGEALRATLFHTSYESLVVTFDHWRPAKDAFGEPTHSKYWRERNVSQLSVSTRRNDWFINRDTLALEVELDALARGYKRVQALGFSMGAYAALRFSKAMHAKRVLLISPQFSVWRDDVPWSRWCAQYAGSDDGSLSSLSKYGKRGQQGELVFDPGNTEDRRHAQMCCATFPRLQRVPFAFAGHPASRPMTKAGFFKVLQEAAVKPASSQGELVATHKAIRRESEIYLAHLRAYLRRRALRAT